jgi:hypothetical protein
VQPVEPPGGSRHRAVVAKAAGLFRVNASLLLVRSPGADYLARVAATARTVPGVIEVAEIRAELIRPGQVHAGLRVVVPAAMSVGRARQVAGEVRRRVHDADVTQYCAIEVQPPPGTPVADILEEVAATPPHCDSLDGPVVAAARLALAAGDVDLILPYVPADGEDEVREARPGAAVAHRRRRGRHGGAAVVLRDGGAGPPRR